MNRFRFLAALAAALLSCNAFADRVIKPSATYLFAQKDTCDLYLDVYEPAQGSATTWQDVAKPSILFIFGGGFIEGTRAEASNVRWFKHLTDDGYRVIAIDYRLGLKGAHNVGIAQAGLVERAIHIAVEDLFSATAYIIDNAQTMGIDPGNIVISGSSAGAITAMQAEWELCNRTALASVLPADFNYAGVMSFSGAIFSRRGTVKYAVAPCPTLMFHGTSDKIVNYRQIWFFNLRFAGSAVVSKSFRKGGYNYDIYRFKDRGHEIATIMDVYYDEEMRFLQENVMGGKKVVIDALVDDETVPVPAWSLHMRNRKDLYGK